MVYAALQIGSPIMIIYRFSKIFTHLQMSHL